MSHILFVCTGNICRSPFAELLAGRLVTELPPDHPAREWSFSSAGVGALEGWPMCEEMAAELTARGVSAEQFTARQITRTVAREADLILTLESTHRAYVLEEWPDLVRRTRLFGHVARIAPELHAQEDFLQSLWAHHEAPNPADQVADPYRQGPAAAAQAAAQIDAALRSLLGLPAAQ